MALSGTSSPMVATANARRGSGGEGLAGELEDRFLEHDGARLAGVDRVGGNVEGRHVGPARGGDRDGGAAAAYLDVSLSPLYA